MALVATVGDATSNSFVTLVEANAYFVDRLHVTEWDDAENPEAALVLASHTLNWYVKWKGIRTTSTQSMQWPRMYCLRPDGSEVDSTIVPTEVKIATYELALSFLADDRMADNPLAGISSLKAGSLALQASPGGVKSTDRDVIPEKVWKILSELYSNGGMSVVRLVRG